MTLRLRSRLEEIGLAVRYAWSWIYPGYSYIILFATARCNARCRFCFYWERAEGKPSVRELSAAELDAISRSMRWVLYLSVGGGEPFLRGDLAQIVRSFHVNSGVRFANISTNGLQRESILHQTEEILSQNPRLRLKLSLSLDDVGNRHDTVRNVAGCFERCVELSDRLTELRERYRNLSVEVASTFSAFNADSIIELIDFVASRMEVDDHTIGLVRGDARDPEALQVDLEKYRQTVEYLIRKRGAGHTHGMGGLFGAVVEHLYRFTYDTVSNDRMESPCVAGSKLITIDERGGLRPCEVLWQRCGDRFDISDLRSNRYDLKASRESGKSASVRRYIRQTGCHCSFECANLCNIIYSGPMLGKVVRKWVANKRSR
jgi:MoaA/NifB/PqqE/SkfB family radical SAM enzyme